MTDYEKGYEDGCDGYAPETNDIDYMRGYRDGQDHLILQEEDKYMFCDDYDDYDDYGDGYEWGE